MHPFLWNSWNDDGNICFAVFETQGVDVKFRVELVWQGGEHAASSIYLTSDGRVILQGRSVPAEERKELALPLEADMISVDRTLVRAIKEML